MVLAVLPMVELVGVAEAVHDGLEDRFKNFREAIYTKVPTKKFRKLAQKLLPIAGPPPNRILFLFITNNPIMQRHILMIRNRWPRKLRLHVSRINDPLYEKK